MDEIQGMTPAQLLAHDEYALARFVDGDFAWMVSSYGSLEAAQDECARFRRVDDYRVVRIEHGEGE